MVFYCLAFWYLSFQGKLYIAVQTDPCPERFVRALLERLFHPVLQQAPARQEDTDAQGHTATMMEMASCMRAMPGPESKVVQTAPVQAAPAGVLPYGPGFRTHCLDGRWHVRGCHA